MFYLQKKINTKVEIGTIEIGLPKKIILRDFYFEDQAKDTLLAGKTLKVDVDLLQLLKNKAEINSIYLEDFTANIQVNKDSVYNFDYIINAFETPKSNTKKGDEESMQISIKKIELNTIKFRYADAISNNNVHLFINHFDTTISTFNLDHLAFNVPDINLNGLKLNLNQGFVEASKTAVTTVKNDTKPNALKLNLKNINLENIDINYKDAISNLDAKIQFKNLKTTVNTIDLEQQLVALNAIELNNTNGQITLTKSEKVETEIETETSKNSSGLPWKIDVNAINITDLNFAFDNNNNIETKKGMDFNHLDFKDLAFKGDTFAIHKNTYSGNIKALTFKEKSGLQLDAFTTKFNYTTTGVSLKNLYLKTPQTTIQNAISVSYSSIESISKNPENVGINVNLLNSKLSFKDVMLLAPQLSANPIFKNKPNTIVNFNAKLKGKLSNLNIETFKARIMASTKIAMHGTIKGLPDIDSSVFNLTVLNFESTAKSIYAFTPKNTIPETIQLPETFNIKGTLKGGINAFKTDLAFKSSLGNALVNATFNSAIKNNETYKVNASLENFDVGQLIKNNQLGKITANADINGTSLNPATAIATLKSTIVKTNLNNYDYKNIGINGTFENGLYKANAHSKDPNLTFNLDAKGALDSIKPTLNAKLNIEIVDVNKLNFYTDSLKMRGTVSANFNNLNPDNLNGTIEASNFLVALKDEQFPIETITINAGSRTEKDSITLKSQFANGKITGNYKLSSLSNQLINSVSKYYKTNTAYAKNSEPQQLDFDFILNNDPVIQQLIPNLKNLSEIKLSGAYYSVNDSLNVNVSIPSLNYANNEISNGGLTINTRDNTLTYNLSLGSLKNPQFSIPKTNISGQLKDHIIDYELNIKDLKNKEAYLISGTVKDSLGASIINFNADKLILNYSKWTIDNDNLIRLKGQDILVSNFSIQNNKQSFSIQSKNNQTNAPIVVDFKDFRLKSLTNIVKSNFDFGGTINGETTISNINTNPLFSADVAIENFKIKNDTVGTINIEINNKTTNLYKAKLALTGFDNQVNIDGDYNISKESLDFTADIKKLKMKSLQPFSLNNLEESVGFLSGKIGVTGKASNPEVIGNLKFNAVGFVVTSLNSRFKLINDAITFKSNKIIFDNFKLKDENDNLLKINGLINSKDYTNLGFDLNVVANNFRAINSKAQDNDLFYGELFLDNNLGIKGTFNNPIIDGNIKINAETKFNIVLPQEDPSIADRAGIVEFVDQDQPTLISMEDPTKQITQTEIKGIDASVNITVDKEAEISIIIDQLNGDYLKLQGEADLTGGIDPSGKTTLTGKYEFTDGAYEMSFNLIKRKFEIESGSYILWTGEPTTANININAIYNVKTAPLDLVDDQLIGVTTETRNTYKQKIPFETKLIMKGELLQPQITFDIILPDGNNNISTEIINTTKAKLEQIRRDEDALNKQVFALLLLNRFIGENPFESETGSTSSAFLAKQSVSKILSQQLNNLAGDLISGFELDFDLEATENYSTGERQERTDLNVGLSKQLLNDRLKVSVGSSFGIEGEQLKNEQTTNLAEDVTIDYLITKDGRYKLRTYRKNNYQVALQGQVIETGVAFIITMSYNKFKALFQKKTNTGRKKRKNNEN
uniref:translocation/assembly module TamB domain-containing protein n=1 Tax=Algibacter pacificus TaxID=2599389 RepID=UPI0011CA1317|nr:translocation/assembly module TamB [Algibacter pacificus]